MNRRQVVKKHVERISDIQVSRWIGVRQSENSSFWTNAISIVFIHNLNFDLTGLYYILGMNKQRFGHYESKKTLVFTETEIAIKI
jgi:hypothetical protein